MSCSPSSTRPRLPARGSVDVSMRSSRYDTRCSRWAKAEALSLPTGMRSMRSDSARSALSRCSVILRCRRPLAAFQRRGQRGDALFEHGEGIAVVTGPGELVDLGRQHVHVVGKPRQRVVGGDIGHDGAKRRDRAFELLDRGGVVIGAQDQVELGAEIADRLVIAGELFGGRQRAQHFADFAERAFDAGQRLAVGAALAGVVDAARQRADFVLDRFDRPARHRLGDGVTNFRQFAAESGDRLLDAVGALQRLDLARDLDQMPFQRGEIRTCGRRARVRPSAVGQIVSSAAVRTPPWQRSNLRHRRCVARRHLPGRRRIEFVLARGDFRDREIERSRAERRRGAIDLGGGALDQSRPGAACPAGSGAAAGWKSATAAHRAARWRRSTAGRPPGSSRGASPRGESCCGILARRGSAKSARSGG